ncbi:hypothetical protein V8E53_006840 [Lactarius tabidus]
MNFILIHSPGETDRGSSSEPSEIEKADKEMFERWKDEADSALVFSGLFSAVGAVSIVESYKWLSPDSGDQTVELLNVTVNLITQLSQQLGIPVEGITVESSEPFQQTFSALMVNVIWFASIVICIGCAVFATLIQQWARRCLALTQGRGTPYERAQLRRFLSKGLKTFQAERIRQLLGMLMHLSLLLYSVGLIVFIFHIDRQLVFMAVGYIFCCFLIYVIPTVLPFFFLNCPFNTPFTAITWRLYHLLMFGLVSIIPGIVTLPHTLLTLGQMIIPTCERVSWVPVGGSKTGSTSTNESCWTAYGGPSSSVPWARLHPNGSLRISLKTTQRRRSKTLLHGSWTFRHLRSIGRRGYHSFPLIRPAIVQSHLRPPSPSSPQDMCSRNFVSH